MITTSGGTRIYIGPTTAAVDAAAYGALSYTEVGGVESLGEFGPEAQDITYKLLGDASTIHLKGSTDYGTLAINCKYDALDAGQVAMVAARKTKFAYAFKVVLNDKADANDTNSIFYFHAFVQSGRMAVGDADNVTARNFIIGLQKEPVEVPATVVP